MMNGPHIDPSDPRMKAAIAELQERIAGHFPTATFKIEVGDDPDGVYLITVVDLDDPDPVLDVVIDRMLEMEVDEGLPLYVVPARTPERIAAMLREESAPFRELPSQRPLVI
jgi:hypothetical protein